MSYDWNQPLLPGTIVCSNFNNFNGEKTVGLFVILYDEQLDTTVTDSKNVIALKLSTKNTCISNYVVNINRELNDFLDDDCIVCCGKLHTLHKREQVYKVLGRLNPITFKMVYKVYQKFSQEINRQMINIL